VRDSVNWNTRLAPGDFSIIWEENSYIGHN